MNGKLASVMAITMMMASVAGPAAGQTFAYKEGVRVSNKEKTFFCSQYDSLMAAGYFLKLNKPKDAERVEGCEIIPVGIFGVARETKGLALHIDMASPTGNRDGWVFLGKFLSPTDWEYKECSQDPHAMGKSLFDCSDFADKENWQN